MLISQIEAGRTYLHRRHGRVFVGHLHGTGPDQVWYWRSDSACGEQGLADLASALLADVTPEAFLANDLLTEEQVALKLGLSTATLRNWRWAGMPDRYRRMGIALPHVELGQGVRYRPRNVRHFLEVTTIPQLRESRPVA